MLGMNILLTIFVYICSDKYQSKLYQLDFLSKIFFHTIMCFVLSHSIDLASNISKYALSSNRSYRVFMFA